MNLSHKSFPQFAMEFKQILVHFIEIIRKTLNCNVERLIIIDPIAKMGVAYGSS